MIKILDLLILEKTKGVNVVDSKIIIPQLGFARDRFDLSICGAIADSCLDSVKVLFFIIKDIGAKPYTAQNLRSEKDFKFPQPVTASAYPALSWDQERLFCPWILPSLSKVQIILLTLMYLAEISINKLLMALQN